MRKRSCRVTVKDEEDEEEESNGDSDFKPYRFEGKPIRPLIREAHNE